MFYLIIIEIEVKKLAKDLDNLSIKINDEYVNFNFTIGISFENRDRILITADMALKIAKRNSENIIIFSENISLNKEYQNNIYWTRKIKTADL